MSIDNEINNLPNRQLRTLRGDETEIYDRCMQPFGAPYATDESQMLNLNQVDALNIDQSNDILVESDSIPLDNIETNDTNADIPFVEVVGASSGSKVGKNKP